MPRRPYMRLWADSFLSDVTTLSDAEVGSYVLVILALWKSPSGKLTPEQLRRAARVGRGWEGRWAALRPYFHEDQDGRIFHARVTKEIAHVERVSAAKVRPRKPPAQDLFSGTDFAHLTPDLSVHVQEDKPLKTHDTPAANGGANGGANAGANADKARATLKTQDSKKDSKRESDSESNPTAPPLPAGAGACDDWPKAGEDCMGILVARVQSPWLDPQKSQGLVSSAGMIARWKLAGYSFEMDVVPVVTGLCGQAKRPIQKWGYFDREMAETHAARTAPLPSPTGYSRLITSADEAAARRERIRAGLVDSGPKGDAE